MAKSLATLTIGQSPRSDILPLLRQHLPDAVTDHAGLLDGLDATEIADHFTPAAGDRVLASRLQSGEQVRLSASKVGQGLQRTISALEQMGYDTLLLLCTGQFSQLVTPRALLLEPELMLFDEVTSALDPEMVTEVQNVMMQLADQKMAMIIVTHDMHFARHIASRVVFCANGKIVEQGPPDRIFRCPQQPRTREFLEKVLHLD